MAIILHEIYVCAKILHRYQSLASPFFLWQTGVSWTELMGSLYQSLADTHIDWHKHWNTPQGDGLGLDKDNGACSQWACSILRVVACTDAMFQFYSSIFWHLWGAGCGEVRPSKVVLTVFLVLELSEVFLGQVGSPIPAGYCGYSSNWKCPE